MVVVGMMIMGLVGFGSREKRQIQISFAGNEKKGSECPHDPLDNRGFPHRVISSS